MKMFILSINTTDQQNYCSQFLFKLSWWPYWSKCSEKLIMFLRWSSVHVRIRNVTIESLPTMEWWNLKNKLITKEIDLYSKFEKGNLLIKLLHLCRCTCIWYIDLKQHCLQTQMCVCSSGKGASVLSSGLPQQSGFKSDWKQLDCEIDVRG